MRGALLLIGKSHMQKNTSGMWKLLPTLHPHLPLAGLTERGQHLRTGKENCRLNEGLKSKEVK